MDQGQEKHTELQNLAGRLEASYSEEQRQKTALVHQRIGRKQVLTMFEKIGNVTNLVDLQKIKESKEYKGLQIPIDGKVVTVTTWADYCRIVEGRSVESIDLDLANINALGEELFDAMHQVGIGPGKMRQYRRLPEDQKTALIEIAKSGDKDSFLDLAEEIINRHSKEKEQLTRERDDAQADYEAQAEVLAKKSADLDSTRMELEKTRKRIQTLPAEQALSELRREVASVAFEAEATLMGKLRQGFDTLSIEGRQCESDERLYMAGLLRQVEVQIAAIREDYDLPESIGTDSAPDWLDPEKAAQVAADIARQRAEKGI